jgi:YD repeat-containing protein
MNRRSTVKQPKSKTSRTQCTNGLVRGLLDFASIVNYSFKRFITYACVALSLMSSPGISHATPEWGWGANFHSPSAIGTCAAIAAYLSTHSVPIRDDWGNPSAFDHFTIVHIGRDPAGGDYTYGYCYALRDSHGFAPIDNYGDTVCASGASYNAASGSCEVPPDPSCKPEANNPNSCLYDSVTAPAAKKGGMPPYCPKGNPIDHGTGNKLQFESDYLGSGGVGLALQRTYNGSSIRNGRYGARWNSNYERMVMTNAYPTHAGVTRSDGKALDFLLNNGSYQPDGDVTDRLTRQIDSAGNTTGWQYLVASDQSLETYDAGGKLLSIASREGLIQTLNYSDASTAATIAPQLGLLIRVIDSFGHQLNFVYDSSSRVIQMADPTGGITAYGYDNLNRLSTVTYPDGKTRTYVYNESAYTGGTDLPTALTGIIDENGSRFAIFNYDSTGKAISTEHAGGVEKYSVAYTQPNTQSTVTDPLGSVRTYMFQTILNTIRNTGVSQPGGAGCSAAASNLTYDANGNVATSTDFNGSVTTYSYDLTRNLETSRVEASGTAQAKTITTGWHTIYRLPLQVAEPKVLTTYVYDTSGNVLSKMVQATSDATGAQGLSPTLVGAARTWSYTYNTVGQVLTVTGPRTDVVDKTTYTYDTSGNLSMITNAVGQVATLSNYDANGRVGLITDANGATTALTYSSRGWLTGKTVTAGNTVETTTYGYDGVGQLTLVTLPDAATVSYTYDPAHRLTNIADSLGNSIAYTLDNMGNRISEQVKDPSGALARQTSRVVDALNRIQQITGAVQ